MRRAGRRFKTMQLIRGRRPRTAQWLAGRLQVSTRTVYRNVANLLQQGTRIQGEAGVSDRMHAGFDLPPLMFTMARCGHWQRGAKRGRISAASGTTASAPSMCWTNPSATSRAAGWRI